MSIKRLKAELERITKDPTFGLQLHPIDDNLFEWKAVICGPEDTCFEGGNFRLKMEFPQDYPKKAPIVTFCSRMFHPNVYPNGKICLDILEMKEKWNPDFDAESILHAIQSMLGDPNPESPANGEANLLYLRNKKEYERKVKEIVRMSIGDDDDETGRNLNIEDVSAELAARVQELDLTGLQADPETVRRFLSQI